MQVLKREFGLYRIRIDCEDDLWTLARLCVKGRSIGMLGERRDQTTAGQEGGRAAAEVIIDESGEHAARRERGSAAHGGGVSRLTVFSLVLLVCARGLVISRGSRS